MSKDKTPSDHDDGIPDVECVYRYIGGKLRSLRVSKGLTQAQVARIIAVSPQQYQRYEDGQSKCSLTYLLRLADHYGVHVSALLPVEPPPPEPGIGSDAADVQMADQADLLSRLVAAFVRLEDNGGKLRLVQLVEALVTSQQRR
jgi:transcriptional regulator with XRE-family HTH domain